MSAAPPSPPSKSEFLLEMFALQQRVPPLLLRSDSLKNDGQLEAAVVTYDELIATLEQLLEVALRHDAAYPDTPFDAQGVVTTLLNALLTQADVCEALRAFARAEALRQRAAALGDATLTPVAAAEHSRQRAAALIAQGRFNEALVLLSDVRDTFQQEGDALQMADVTADIAGILEWLGDFDRALEEANTAERMLASSPEGPTPGGGDLTALLSAQLVDVRREKIALALEQIEARVYRYSNRFAEAEGAFRRIRPRIPKTARPAIDFQFAAILVGRARYAEGLAAIDKIEGAFRGLLRPKLGVMLMLKAECLLGLGKAAEALSEITTASDDLASHGDRDSLWKALWVRARILEALRRPAQALTAYAELVHVVNELRKAPLGYRLDSTYLRGKLPAFEAAIALAAKRRDGPAACRFMEAIKSRILTATLSIPRDREPARATDLEKQLDELSRQIDAVEYARDGSPDDAERERRRRQLAAARVDLVERLRFSDSRWRSLSEPVPFELQRTQRLLASRTQAALTLFYQRGQVTGVALVGGKATVATQPVSAKAAKALEAYLRNLQAEKPRPQLNDPSSSLGLDAADVVPKELLTEALVPGGLMVAPHGSLHLLPWAGLSYQGKRLFEYCPVSVLPSISCIASLDADFSARPRVALIGVTDYGAGSRLRPLPLADEEVATIRDTYATAAGLVGEVRLNATATESAFWGLARHEEAEGSILHVACHADFVTDDPIGSGLMLGNGKLDATEIARGQLRYQEVVLSACSTGRRPTSAESVELAGDDILGLPGAFLEAGARSVLVSIPEARDDVTLEFMTLYHEHRSGGEPPMRALRETQLALLGNQLYPPHLWIGFTLYGCQ